MILQLLQASLVHRTAVKLINRLLIIVIISGFTGGLFDDSESLCIEGAFRYAIYRVNNDDSLLGRTRLSYDIQHLPAANSFMAAKKGKSKNGVMRRARHKKTTLNY